MEDGRGAALVSPPRAGGVGRRAARGGQPPYPAQGQGRRCPQAIADVRGRRRPRSTPSATTSRGGARPRTISAMRSTSTTAITSRRVEDVTTGSGTQYRVFSLRSGRRSPQQMPPDDPLARAAQDRSMPSARWPASDDSRRVGSAPHRCPTGRPGSTSGPQASTKRTRRSRSLRAQSSTDYDEHDRNMPSIEGTSRLSPHLAFRGGQPTPRLARDRSGRGQGVQRFPSANSAGATSPSGLVLELPRLCRQERARANTTRSKWRRSGKDLAGLAEGPRPDIRSSTPACASSGRPAGSTIACG